MRRRDPSLRGARFCDRSPRRLGSRRHDELTTNPDDHPSRELCAMRHFWGFLFGAVLLGAFLLTALAPLFGWWIPRSVSTYSGQIDTLYYWILGVTGFFFVLTEA